MDEEKISIPTETSNRGLWAAIVVLICAAAISVGYAVYQHGLTAQLSSQNQQANTRLAGTQNEIQALTQKLNTMESAQVIAKTPQPVEAAGHHRVIHPINRYRRRPVDAHWKKLEAELAEHQKAIASTQDDLAKTRSELENNLSSTRDELNGSIAKNHEQLVNLEKKGERNYYEFDIAKSKLFNRAGTVGIKLRKANVKHQYADLELIVDDRELTKKHVNIFEPVLFYPEGSRRPVELVINGIHKNEIHGYVSAPKYKSSELNASNTGPAAPNQAGNAAVASVSNSASAPTTPTPAPGELRHRQNTPQP